MKQLFFTIAIATIALTSCKKDSQSSPAPAPGKRVVHYQDPADLPYATTITYDNEGRIVTEEASVFKYTYQYTAGKCHFESYSKTQQHLTMTSDMTLNAAGYVTHCDQTIFANPNTTLTATQDYQYDNEGRMIHSKSTISNTPDVTEQNFTYSNGNLSKITTLKNGIAQHTFDYTYSDKEDKMNISAFSFVSIVSNLYGKKSQKLPLKVISTDIASANTAYTDYIFQLDADGYPSKFSIYNSITNLTTHVEFTYDK